MRIAAGLCAALALAGCDKKQSDAPKQQEAPPPSKAPTDWKAQAAKVTEGDFDALCKTQEGAQADNASDVVAQLDALGDKWKAASIETMRARTKAAGTNPQLVALFESTYSHTLCNRSLGIAQKLTLDVTIPRAGGKDINAKIQEVAKDTVFSPEGFAAALSNVAGPWLKFDGSQGGMINLMSSIGADGQLEIAGNSVPRLTAKSSLFVNGEKVVATDPLAAQGGAVTYTRRTNTRTGESNTDDAIYQATEQMVLDLGQQTAAKLGLALPP